MYKAGRDRESSHHLIAQVMEQGEKEKRMCFEIYTSPHATTDHNAGGRMWPGTHGAEGKGDPASSLCYLSIHVHCACVSPVLRSQFESLEAVIMER